MNRRDVIKLLSALPAIPVVKSIEKLKIEPNEVVVISYDERLSPDHIELVIP